MEKGSAKRRCVFIFLSKHRNKIKLLHWQNDGFVIYSKRLEKGTFELPKDHSIELTAHQLQFILDGIYLSSIKRRVRYEHTNVNNFIGELGASASV